jgi:thymidylate synthase ThyX
MEYQPSNNISAVIIADSKNELGQRLTTFVLEFPRIVLAEFNTHRILSRNSASSRAIPFKTMLKKVMEDPFIPIAWQKDHVGMQGTDYFTQEEIEEYGIIENYLFARDCAVQSAKRQSQLTKLPNGKWLGVTKQLVNRLLEPFLYHKVICTGTEWENFFALRAHKDAEIHIADLAQKMLDAYNNSEPNQLKENQWHIPFGDKFDLTRLNEMVALEINTREEASKYNELLQDLKVKIATARCARVSYDNFDGTDSYQKDIELFNRLKESGHMSPFEHCAKAMTYEESISFISSSYEKEEYGDTGWCGNFRGFIQLRKTISGENKLDKRVILK